MSELETLDPKQVWLLNYQNPLTQKFGKEFFKSVPVLPGVYWMLGRQGEVLYIGKAKNLRNRLRSYQRAKPEQVSRKVLRLVYLVNEIRWEVVATEKDALLRENALLREHQPPFNVMNTHPETYLFIGFGVAKEEIQLCLSNPSWKPEALFEADLCLLGRQLKTTQVQAEKELFGAFKGRGLIRGGYAALLRLIWLALADRHQERFEIPSVLVRRRVPDFYSISFRPNLASNQRLLWERAIRRFLKGTSVKLLELLSVALLELTDIPPFYYGYIQDDLELLKEFYAYGPQRNRTLRRFHGRGGEAHLIAQDEIDDLLVTFRIGETL
ncbi:MAG: nucleotide excision repair endonuclease [Bdellovibrio sp.]|nr:nucleotide excision repair endonuclease [Bdellovibrio sp.]